MTAYVDAEHVRKLIEAGTVERLGVETSQAAERHLVQTFPLRWAPTIVEWARIPSTRLQWNLASDDEASAWASGTLAGRRPYGLLLFSTAQPCLLGPFDFMVRSLDTLLWRAAGCRILFGVDRDGDGRIHFTNGVVEFDGAEKLFATIEE